MFAKPVWIKNTDFKTATVTVPLQNSLTQFAFHYKKAISQVNHIKHFPNIKKNEYSCYTVAHELIQQWNPGCLCELDHSYQNILNY